MVTEPLTPRPAEAAASRWLYAAFAAVLALATALRCWQIDYNFDADEVFSIELATRPFTGMISGALLDTPHPPLHIVLLYAWTKPFGASARRFIWSPSAWRTWSTS